MAKLLKPHSPAWFAAVSLVNPLQAAVSKMVVESVGRVDVCSACGNEPAPIYEVVDLEFTPNIAATLRLCDDCLEARRASGSEIVPAGIRAPKK